MKHTYSIAKLWPFQCHNCKGWGTNGDWHEIKTPVTDKHEIACPHWWAKAATEEIDDD